MDTSIGRAAVRLSSSELLFKQLAEDLPQEIRDDLEAFDSQIAAIATAVVENESSGGGKVVHITRRITETGTSPSSQPTEPFLDEWMFDDWRLHIRVVDDELDYKLTQRFEYKLVEGTAGEATPYYLSIWELDSDGSRMEPKLRVSKFEVVRRSSPAVQLRWFDPRLDLAVEAGFSLETGDPVFGPSIGLSLASYGEEGRPDWRFLRVGVSATEDLGITGCPAVYNVSNHIPLLRNVWLGPCYTWTSGVHNAMISLGGTL